MNWTLFSAALLLAVLVYKAVDIGRRLSHNRREFAQHFPVKMQRAVSIWTAVALATFIGCPTALIFGFTSGSAKLSYCGAGLGVYAVMWTLVGHYILLTQREYLRWLHQRYETIHYLQTPPEHRPPLAPGG